jgi:hypothetical protein
MEIKQGWQCPNCKMIYAPWIDRCSCGTAKTTTTGGDWEKIATPIPSYVPPTIASPYTDPYSVTCKPDESIKVVS